MASKLVLSVLLFLVLVATQAEGNNNFNLVMASRTLSDKGYQPPLTLLQYHVVPSKLDGHALESLPHGSKIDTLLLGHPLVVTTLPTDEFASINGVKVAERDLYNDGGLIVHGVDNFFDPAF
ncbi:putative fasciclin-like arabinogalactan protein 20 [Ziziphus jujuba]|uniref:Fasciclin-like arabinogalactan protein 20 n=1 Tax=Ziziphus jujuba TaxID=326968 RepID=A0A6P4ANW2_ZIZJJ|nr:putative fasciclin-like arabinogalactan protein 20 [Ziziphus jujuba]